MLLINLHN